QRVVRMHLGAPSTPPEPAQKTAVPRTSKLDAFGPRIKELLTQYPAITAQRIFEELLQAGYMGGMSILKERVHKLRPPPPPTPSRQRPLVGPGEEAEQDWSPHRIDFSTGARTVHAFLLVLSHSRRRYLDFF